MTSNIVTSDVLFEEFSFVCIFFSCYRVPPGHGKSRNLGRPFSRPGKSWKIAKVMESHGKVMENDDNVMEFYYCTEQFCKSDTTSSIKLNCEP